MEHETRRAEIADLFAVGDRDLAACQTAGLAAGWRFNLAYNAALQAAAAALAAAGYQAERSSRRYTLEVFRKKRNITDYERAETVSDLEAEEMRKPAAGLHSLTMLGPGVRRRV